MRLQQSDGGGEITPYLRETQEERETRKLYFTAGYEDIYGFITGCSVISFYGFGFICANGSLQSGSSEKPTA